jgi:hypothetical protein
VLAYLRGVGAEVPPATAWQWRVALVFTTLNFHAWPADLRVWLAQRAPSRLAQLQATQEALDAAGRAYTAGEVPKAALQAAIDAWAQVLEAIARLLPARKLP